MTLYRFYCLDDLGNIEGGMGLHMQDDLSAIEAAQERCKGGTFEVWQGERRVISIVKKCA